MLDFEKDFTLSKKDRRNLNHKIKLGIYKELNRRKLLSDSELSFLLQKEGVFLKDEELL